MGPPSYLTKYNYEVMLLGKAHWCKNLKRVVYPITLLYSLKLSLTVIILALKFTSVELFLEKHRPLNACFSLSLVRGFYSLVYF